MNVYYLFLSLFYYSLFFKCVSFPLLFVQFSSFFCKKRTTHNSPKKKKTTFFFGFCVCVKKITFVDAHLFFLSLSYTSLPPPPFFFPSSSSNFFSSVFLHLYTFCIRNPYFSQVRNKFYTCFDSATNFARVVNYECPHENRAHVVCSFKKNQVYFLFF